MRGGKELPSVPLPAWIQVRLKSISSLREFKRLLRTPYIAREAHPAWREWAAPRDVKPPAAADDRIAGRGPVLVRSA
jgi:hypothetical protein